MTGWEKVAAATVIAVVGLIGLNLSIWRRLRAARTAALRAEADPPLPVRAPERH